LLEASVAPRRSGLPANTPTIKSVMGRQCEVLAFGV